MDILDKIKIGESTIGIIGLGYVGLPLMLEFAKKNKVIGFDIDGKKIEQLNRGESYIKHISSSAIMYHPFTATEDFTKISSVDAIIICVPTPLNGYREPDLSFITTTIKLIQPFLKEGQAISLESTTYPGTTEEILRPMIEEMGFTIGENFFLIYSPEREDPGRKNYNLKTIPKICGGSTPKCLEIGVALYKNIVDEVISVSSTQTAELTKILENVHRAVNIGLVNEMKIVADKMGIDIFEVIRAAATKPFGFSSYFPGPGIGGHCIPIDPFYLTWKAREYGIHTRFIELSGEINASMPDYVVSKIQHGLNDRKKPLKGSKILILGVAYKKNVDDLRESPSLSIMKILQEKGALINYSDPHIPTFPQMRNYSFDLESINLDSRVIQDYDCIVLATDHDDFDYKLIQKNSDLIVDTRGVYKETDSNIIRA
jgi:UDP-N-acetyl-D-glucosamine dehydrogenase